MPIDCLLTSLPTRHLFRRSAFKALSATSSFSAISKPRSVATSATRFTLRPKQQWAVSPFQKRFATGDTAPPSAEKTTSETVSETPSQSEAEALAESSATQPVKTPAEQTETTTEAAAGEVAAQAEPGSSDAFGKQSQSPIHPLSVNRILIMAGTATSESAQAASAGAGAAAFAAPDTTVRRPRTMPGAPNPTVYVGNLYFEVNDNALRQHFEPFGTVKSVRIVYDHRGLSKG
jgi:nucleolin